MANVWRSTTFNHCMTWHNMVVGNKFFNSFHRDSCSFPIGTGKTRKHFYSWDICITRKSIILYKICQAAWRMAWSFQYFTRLTYHIQFTAIFQDKYIVRFINENVRIL